MSGRRVMEGELMKSEAQLNYKARMKELTSDKNFMLTSATFVENRDEEQKDQKREQTDQDLKVQFSGRENKEKGF
jgi:hypothetical protein